MIRRSSVGELLNEFEFLINEKAVDPVAESTQLIKKAKQIKSIGTINGIDTEKILRHLRFNATEKMPWEHVTLVITPDLFNDINSERSTDFVMFNFVEEIESNVDSHLGVIANSFKNKVEHLTITKNIKIIGDWAFAFYKNLKSVSFETGSKLTSIGKYAFSYCTKLIKLDLTNCKSLVDLPNYLMHSSGVKELRVTADINGVNPEVFNGSNVKYIYVGESKFLVQEYFERQARFNGV